MELKISREFYIKIIGFFIISPLFIFVILIGDKILLNFLNRNINIAKIDQKRFFNPTKENINYKNVGKYISEGSLLTDATKRLSHHDSVQDDYLVTGKGSEIIWIFGDSWLEGIREENMKNNIIGRELNENYNHIRFIGTSSFSPLLMHLAYKDRVSRYKEIPDNVVLFIDQTDIGDDYCRYRPSVIRNRENKLIGVLNNNLAVNGVYRRWGFHLTMREHNSGIILAFHRLIHALHLRLIPSIDALTDCTEKELISWHMGLNTSPSGAAISNYKKYFLINMNEFLDTINSYGKRKKLLLVTHDWARHSLPKNHKDFLPNNITSIVKEIAEENNINHLYVKTKDYKKNIYDIYRYPADRFSHLKNYSYLSKRIGESIKSMLKKDQ